MWWYVLVVLMLGRQTPDGHVAAQVDSLTV